MKLKEALAVLAWSPTVYDAKDNMLYSPDTMCSFGKLDYDTLVITCGEAEVDEISAWHDCELIVKLKGIYPNESN